MCVCRHDLQRLRGHRAWMPITDCFMKLASVFKHHEELMTSLFLLWKPLPVSSLDSWSLKGNKKTSGSFSTLTGYHGQLFMRWYTLAVLILTFVWVSLVFVFIVFFLMKQRQRKQGFHSRWAIALKCLHKRTGSHSPLRIFLKTGTEETLKAGETKTFYLS